MLVVLLCVDCDRSVKVRLLKWSFGGPYTSGVLTHSDGEQHAAKEVVDPYEQVRKHGRVV